MNISEYCVARTAAELNDLEMGSIVLVNGVAWQSFSAVNGVKHWESTMHQWGNSRYILTSDALMKEFKKGASPKSKILILWEEKFSEIDE